MGHVYTFVKCFFKIFSRNDEHDRLKELSKLGDPLERLNKYITWKQFRGILSRTLQKENKRPGGKPPFDYLMIFKILILQTMYNISDSQAQYQIKDRLSFMKFLGLALCDMAPDKKTIWELHDNLVQAEIIDTMFYQFTQQSEKKKIITYSGSIIDAAFVEAPRQRNSRKENEEIKAGKVPDEWDEEKNRNKGRQKDTDAP